MDCFLLCGLSAELWRGGVGASHLEYHNWNTSMLFLQCCLVSYSGRILTNHPQIREATTLAARIFELARPRPTPDRLTACITFFGQAAGIALGPAIGQTRL